VLPRHVVLLFTLAMLWGTSFLVIKIGVGHMPALTLTALRLATAAAVMVALALAVRTPLPNGVRAWSFCFALAFFGNSLPFFLISWGEEGIQSG
ncbi:EamA family transporter, partial [Levilactobacillus namurensis]|uniref:EamA family transporter n=1 Tax=Levilactobacillus namurensis TaxID=380393 RepID=UPI002230AD31